MLSRSRAQLAGCALVACFTLWLSAATEASAPAPLYVDTGSIGGPCSDARTASAVSVTTPLCTLAKAAQLVTAGGTILVRAGTYPKLTVARAFTQKVTIKAFPGELPELRGAHFPVTARNVRLEHFRVSDITETEGDHLELVDNDMSPSGIVLNGNYNLAEGNYIHNLRITFDESSTAARCHSLWRLDGENDQNHDGQYDYPLSQTGGIAPRCGHAFRVKGTNNVIRGNFVRKVPADGVQATATSNLLVEGNHFEDIAVQSSADGGDPLEHTDGAQLLGDNKDAVFRNNVYIDTRGLLAMLDRNNQWPTNLRVENNVFHTATKDTGRGIGCIHASAVTGMTIVNNTCWGAGDFDPRIRISDGTPTTSDISETTGVVLKNNIIERYVTEGSVGVTEDYNLIKRYEAVDGPGLGTHSSIGEPVFAANDLLLRLASGSAGIDAGTSDGAPGRDREGRPRCDEASAANAGGGAQPYFDLGANEFGSGGPSCKAVYSEVVSADGPSSYWRLGEPTGTVASDRVGTNPGAYMGGLTLGQPGAVTGDSAVRLNGSGQIRVPDSPSLDTGDSFTLELWVKLAALRTTMGLASKGSYLVYLDSAGYVNLRKPGAGAVTRSTAAISDTSAYHHVVVAKAGAAARIYIDGVNRTGTVTNRAIGNTTSALLLGNGSGYLNGTLDEVALYPRALAASEVADHYAAR